MHAQLLNMAYAVSHYEKPVRLWLCKKCTEDVTNILYVKDLTDNHVCTECGSYDAVALYEKIRS